MDLRKLAQTRLHVMDISVRGHKALQREGIQTFGDLAKPGVLDTLGNSYEVRDVQRAVTGYLLRLIREENESRQ